MIAYNNHEIDASWLGKAEGQSEWSHVWQLLGLPPPASTDSGLRALSDDTTTKKCVVKRPNGETMTVTLENLSVRCENGAVRTDWPAKLEDALDWTTVGAILGTQPPASANTAEPTAVAAAQPVSSAVAKSVKGPTIDRYLDAYRVAAATVAMGTALKVLAICLAGLCLIVGTGAVRDEGRLDEAETLLRACLSVTPSNATSHPSARDGDQSQKPREQIPVRFRYALLTCDKSHL